MKYSLMSLMVDSELRHEKVSFILEAILRGVGVTDIPATADEAYALLNQRGIPMRNGSASYEDMVRFAAENGFDGLNLMYFQMELYGPKVSSIMEQYGVVLSSVNIIMPFSEASSEEMYQGILAAARQAIDHTIAAGAKEIMLVPGGYVLGDVTREQAFQNMTRGLRDCIAYADGRIPISTETLESICVPWSAMGEMQRVFAAVSGLGYTHDAGNPLVANEDPMALLAALKDKVVSVHFKDLGYTDETQNVYRCMDGRALKLVPLGTGEVDFRAHVKALLEMGYDGCIALEGGRSAENKWQEALEALRYFRALEQNVQAEA